jgi:hypothetical protein
MPSRFAMMSKTYLSIGMSVITLKRAGKPHISAQDKLAFEEYKP